MVAIASDLSDPSDLTALTDDPDSDTSDTDGDTSPLAALRAAPLKRDLAAAPKAAPKPSKATTTKPRLVHVRLTGAALAARRAAVAAQRRLERQRPARWYERLAGWLLTLPLALQPGWWDTRAVVGGGTARYPHRPQLRRVMARERARLAGLAWRVMGHGAGGQAESDYAGWASDTDPWRVQVAEILRRSGLIVEVSEDARTTALHYTTRAPLRWSPAATNRTLDAVLDGRMARTAREPRERGPRPRRMYVQPSQPASQPTGQHRVRLPGVSQLTPPAFPAFTGYWPVWPVWPVWPTAPRPLASIPVTPPPLPPSHHERDWTDTFDPWD